MDKSVLCEVEQRNDVNYELGRSKVVARSDGGRAKYSSKQRAPHNERKDQRYH